MTQCRQENVYEHSFPQCRSAPHPQRTGSFTELYFIDLKLEDFPFFFVEAKTQERTAFTLKPVRLVAPDKRITQ